MPSMQVSRTEPPTLPLYCTRLTRTLLGPSELTSADLLSDADRNALQGYLFCIIVRNDQNEVTGNVNNIVKYKVKYHT